MNDHSDEMDLDRRCNDGGNFESWRYIVHDRTNRKISKCILDELVFNRPDVRFSEDVVSNKIANEELVIGSGSQKLVMKNRLLASKPQIAYQNGDMSLGLSLGCALSNIPIPVGPRIVSSDEVELLKSYNPSLIFQLSPYRKEFDLDLLKRSNGVDIKISDNPLSFEPLYFTEKGKRYHRSPGLLLESRKKGGLDKFVETIREMVDVPIIITISANDIANGIDGILVADPDAVRIVADSYSPLDITDNNEIFRRDPVSSLSSIGEHIDTFKSRDNGMKVIIDARIDKSSDIIKMLCLGADGICLDYLIKDVMIDHISSDGTDMEKGTIDLTRAYEGSFDWASIGESLSNMILSVENDIRSIIHSLGIQNYDKLNSELLRATTYDSAAISGLKIAGRELPLAMWRH